MIADLLKIDALVTTWAFAIRTYPKSNVFIDQFMNTYNKLEQNIESAKQAQGNQDPAKDSARTRGLFKQNFHNRRIIDSLSEFTRRAAESYKPGSNIYSPYFSLFQSSGIGKSRCLLEMGRNDHMMLYCCVRDRQSSEFPRAAHRPEEFNGWSETDWSLYLCASVRAMAHTWATGQVKDMGGWIDYHAIEEPDAWGKTVIGQFQAIKREFGASSQEANPDIFATRSISAMFLAELEGLYKAVNTTLQSLSSLPLLVFVFDEAGFLLKSIDQNMFSKFRRGIKSIFPFHGSARFSCISILTDTMSAISNFAPPTHMDHSVREIGGELMAPFYLLKSIPMAPFFGEGWMIKSAAEAVKMCNVLALSRPLFWRGQSSDNVDMLSTLELAKAKLVYCADMSKVSEQLGRAEGFATSLALFFARIQLAVVEMPSVSAELVRSRMAFCREISDDRSHLSVGYVSEPVVAEASCFFWNDEDLLAKVLDHLLIYTKRTGTYNKGNVGELVAMIILCLAWNKACQVQRNILCQSASPTPDDCFPFSRLITVKEYLRALLGDNGFEANSEPLSEGVVYFSHFRKIHYMPSKGMFLEFFRRGAAIICKNQEEGLDLVIPVILPGSCYELVEANIAFISCADQKPKVREQVSTKRNLQ